FRESGKNVTTATGAQSSSTVYTWDVSAASTSPGTIVISNIKVNVASNASQDVKVQVSGAGITTKTVTVGSLSSTAKATISATSKPALKVNMPNQAGGDIVITESNAGALPTGTFVFLHVFDQIADSSALVTFGAKPSINVTDGNAEAGSAAYVSGTGLQDFQTIVFQVTNTSTAASTFKISGIKYDVTSKAINGDVIVDVRTNTTDSAAGFSSGTRLATVANATIGAATPTFSDVPATHWAFSAIEFLASAGIINGRTSGLFDPNASITRGEFAKIICLAAGLTPVSGGTASFSDTSGNWAAGYIEAAKTAGLIGGYPDGTFRPNNLITRAEIAKLVVLGAGFATDTSGAGFTDIDGNWAKDFILTAANNGVVNGYTDGTFRPNNHATRAEASVMVYNWLAGI
ncbi:MAG: S-layer homology domain-containing protein, partial [Candidatus Aquicultor sp.]